MSRLSCDGVGTGMPTWSCGPIRRNRDPQLGGQGLERLVGGGNEVARDLIDAVTRPHPVVETRHRLLEVIACAEEDSVHDALQPCSEADQL